MTQSQVPVEALTVTAVESNISVAMQEAVGSLLSRRVSFPIDRSDIRRWAIAVYWPDPPPLQFWDEEHARRSPHGGIVAPEEFNPFAWMTAEPRGTESVDRTDPDLTEKTLGVRGPGLRFQLNGGIEVDYHERMRPGDVITAERRLRGYRERAGRLGLMLFTTVEERWTNQRRENVKLLRQTGIRY